MKYQKITRKIGKNQSIFDRYITKYIYHGYNLWHMDIYTPSNIHIPLAASGSGYIEILGCIYITTHPHRNPMGAWLPGLGVHVTHDACAWSACKPSNIN